MASYNSIWTGLYGSTLQRLTRVRQNIQSNYYTIIYYYLSKRRKSKSDDNKNDIMRYHFLYILHKDDLQILYLSNVSRVLFHGRVLNVFCPNKRGIVSVEYKKNLYRLSARIRLSSRVTSREDTLYIVVPNIYTRA